MCTREEAPLLTKVDCTGLGVVKVNGDGGGGGGMVGRAGSNDLPEAAARAALPGEKDAVLLDVRNVYETSIGHFRCARRS